jgi:hypothetical protein
VRALIAIVLLGCAAHASAQAIYQCEGAGSGGYTENQCPPGYPQKRLPPPPAELHPDIERLCPPGPQKDMRRHAGCLAMVACRVEDRTSCSIYCSYSFQKDFPELRLGPTSRYCLQLTGYKRGPNWVQAVSRAMFAGGYDLEVFSFWCLDSRNSAFPQHARLYCRRNSSDCARHTHELGAQAQPLEVLATAVCSETYGTQLAPEPPSAQRSWLQRLREFF